MIPLNRDDVMTDGNARMMVLEDYENPTATYSLVYDKEFLRDRPDEPWKDFNTINRQVFLYKNEQGNIVLCTKGALPD